MNRQIDLTALVDRSSIDPEIRMLSLDGWSKIEFIAQGTFGAVWKYGNLNASTPIVAGKHMKFRLINLNQRQENQLKKRVDDFIKELNILHKVSSGYSDRFVLFIGCYLDSKKFIIFTEYMSNGSVRSLINNQPLTEARALKFIFQVTEGLQFLHHYHFPGKRIMHRDIKCDNLLLTNNLDVKLADFGLACVLTVDFDSHTTSQSAPSDCAGTIFFSAPEVLKGTKYGRRADIWSLGCTLVEMLTCYPPHFDAFRHLPVDRARALFIHQACADPADQLQYIGSHLVPHVSTSVHKLLDCLFIKDKEFRPISDAVHGVFVFDRSAPAPVTIDETKVDHLQLRLRTKIQEHNQAIAAQTTVVIDEAAVNDSQLRANTTNQPQNDSYMSWE